MQEKLGFGTQTPPAIFPTLFGLMGLGLSWRRATDVWDTPFFIANAVFGIAFVLLILGMVSYGLKTLRRPGVLIEEMQRLPGRAGLTALVLSLYLIATGLTLWVPGLARILIVIALPLHAGLIALFVHWFVRAAPEERQLNPTWHLHFVGFIIAAPASVLVGWDAVAVVLLILALPLAAAIWLASFVVLLKTRPPAAARPLLAIHLAPASLLGTVSVLLGMMGLAWFFVCYAALIWFSLVIRARWVAAAGFSPLWGSFTFPLAAFAGLCLLMADRGQGAGFGLVGAAALAQGSVLIPYITWRTLQMWRGGVLASKTQAVRV